MKTCSRCIYNEKTPGIVFGQEGICNYCRITEQMEKEYPDGPAGEKIFSGIAKEIIKAGKGKKYDCVIGVSGGCDSSYLVYMAKKYGLRPLAVHFDNTWNSTIAVENIKRVLKKLDVDLYTYVVDNEEFNDMARSFLEASVPEIDALSDVALTTVLYMAAAKYGVKYIFDGHNFRTEGITPLGWVYFDGKYIDSIHKRFGKMKMKTFPNLWFLKWMKWLLINRPKRLRPLYYLDFDKEKVKKFLNDEFGWQWYGGHHMENKYTLFNNNFILPKKFNMDLRYVEFSALIRSGQMTRERALAEIGKPLAMEEEIMDEVKKRLGYTGGQFEEIMKKPIKTAKDYPTYHPLFRAMRPVFWLMYKADLVPKSFYIKYTK
jgi:N-acetyl sugar amidotransferase